MAFATVFLIPLTS